MRKRDPGLRNFLLVAACASALFAPTTEKEASIFEVRTPHGLIFTLQHSPTPQKYLIETMPGGVALLDCNNDGLLDIFLVNGGQIKRPSNDFSRHDPRYWNRLFRQNKDASFTDVTEQAGLADAGEGNYGMGVAVGERGHEFSESCEHGRGSLSCRHRPRKRIRSPLSLAATGAAAGKP